VDQGTSSKRTAATSNQVVRHHSHRHGTGRGRLISRRSTTLSLPSRSADEITLSDIELVSEHVTVHERRVGMRMFQQLVNLCKPITLLKVEKAVSSSKDFDLLVRHTT
jgi:hypothetical protein